MVTVGCAKGDDRFGNVLLALQNAGESLKKKIRGRVVVKVNTVVQDASLANTHCEALRAVLAFLEPLHPAKVTVGEATCNGLALFDKCGYTALQNRYSFELLDFNTTGYDEFELLSIERAPLKTRITKIRSDCDCLISLAVPKAHSDAIVTLSAKNMMGFVCRDDQKNIHGVRNFWEHRAKSTKVIHKNVRSLLKMVRPDIAVLDGFTSFEGGPVPQIGQATQVEPHVAFAGSDFVAVDTVAATAFGFDPRDIGYLAYSVEDGYGNGDLSQVEVVGTSLKDAFFKLQPSPNVDELLRWRD
jgi:uncharacterized protein (DUF362 family)